MLILNRQKIKLSLMIAVGAGICAVVILTILLFQQYNQIRHLDYISARHPLWRSLRGSGPLTAADASSTQVWMTFDYIDHVFALPPDYLKTTLGTTDSRYPRLTIAQYAKDAGLPANVILLKVQDSIRSFSTVKQ